MMKYQTLRAKKVGDKDLEMRDTYRKKRLYEVREKELLQEEYDDDSFSTPVSDERHDEE